MNKLIWLIIPLILIIPVFAENLYYYESLELELDVSGRILFSPEAPDAKLKSARVTLNIYPQDSYRQQLLSWNSEGKVQESRIVFDWADGRIEEKEYGFSAAIKTYNERKEINSKVKFPLRDTQGYEQYLTETKTIDKDNPKIISKAAEVAEGEDDLFAVVFNLLRWVEENIEYDLNTLTSGASQKASWVLENRQGVCDEMTSLFIAMCRSLGIPARFVSGISYTTSELFQENWLPHGWAEVYFPDYGWVSFDPAFGEYGYVDVTHIKLRDGFDPAEPSTNFEWLAEQVRLESGGLNLSIKLREKGQLSGEEIFLEGEIIGREVDLGSYNLIKGIVSNKQDYYVAARLKLAVPAEVQVFGENKRIIMLKPKETKEVFWIVRVDDSLDSRYWYEFPALIYTETNLSVQEKFKAVKGGIHYSDLELQKFIGGKEEKRYIPEIEIGCSYQEEIMLGEEQEIVCKAKNKGNSNLMEITFCLDSICRQADLLINQETELKITVEGKQSGWEKITSEIRNKEVEKKLIIHYAVLDEPKAGLRVSYPEAITYRDSAQIILTVNKSSFSDPQEVFLILTGPNFKNRWEISELKGAREFDYSLDSKGLGKNNRFAAVLQWKDRSGKIFSEKKEFTISTQGRGIKDSIAIILNSIANFFKGIAD